MNKKTKNTTTNNRMLPVKSGSKTPAITTNINKLGRALKNLKVNNPEEVILLDEVCDLLPKIDREEVISFLQKEPSGDFIEGRRGHPSRFVYGNALEKWKHSEEIRKEWRKRNGRNPLTGALLRGPNRVPARRGPGRPPGSKNRNQSRVPVPRIATSEGDISREMSLRVTVGDKEVSIPLKVELQTVA